MRLKQIVDEDFTNYKKPAMFLIFPSCSFKCDLENGCKVCQNSELKDYPVIDIPIHLLVSRYLENSITSAIVCGGLEPFDSGVSLYAFISKVRDYCDDDIVIYTGYKEEEIPKAIEALSNFKNIIVKFGRFIPNQKPHYDEVLGVNLASDNQYARRIEYNDY